MENSIGSQYFAVYYIWLESHTYVCFQEQLDGILELIGEKGQYEPAWDAYNKGYARIYLGGCESKNSGCYGGTVFL